MRRTPPAGRCSPPHGAVAGAALRVLAEERIFLAEFDCGHIRNIPTFDWAFPASSSFYHLLSPKGGAKSVRRAPTSGSDGAMRNLRCTARNDDYLLISYFSRSLACRIALRKERKDSYAPLHSVRNDKSCHPQEEVQTNSDTGIAPCIAPQTAEKKAVSDRFSAHLPENRKIIRNFAGQSINCRARI